MKLYLGLAQEISLIPFHKELILNNFFNIFEFSEEEENAEKIISMHSS